VEVGMSPLVFGGFMTVTALSGIVISMLVARRSDSHWTRRTTMLIGGAGGLAGYLAYAFVRDTLALTIIGMTVVALAQVNFSQVFAHGREELSRDRSMLRHV